jgi:glucuronate isomerase
MTRTWTLDPDRLFAAEPRQRGLARRLYEGVAELPLVCPHGHVPPRLLADPDATLGTPADLFVIPDHYVTRMLYSQGVSLASLGVPTRERGAPRGDDMPVETDHREVWRRFAAHLYLFRGTPTGLWLKDELVRVFGVTEPLNADAIYDALSEKLAAPEYRPRALFRRFNIEVLCTTDAATDTLAEHRALRAEGWTNVRPTFRPDAVVDLSADRWREHIAKLGEVSGTEIADYRGFIGALEARRAFFKELGATAADHAAEMPHTERLSVREVETIFRRALADEATTEDAARFCAHMLLEMARMSAEDGLVMQLHVGSLRNHNRAVFERFGLDRGADIPLRTEWTRSLHALLNAYGSDPTFRLVVFTLDESTYGRELAPLAGHYPALRLGPPWWFFDSVKGIERYLDSVVETAGVYNLAGFNDDTRAFASIPARHDVWRRTVCNWLAGETLRGILEEDEAAELASELAYGLARRTYRLA